MKTLLSLLTTIVVLTYATSIRAAEEVMVDFSQARASDYLRTNNAAAALARHADGTVLHVVTGTNESWPGVTLLVERPWNLAPFANVVVPLRNAGSNPVTVSCRVDNPGANGTEKCVTGSVSLPPGISGELRIELKRTANSQLDGKLFGMRGYPVAPGGPGTVNPSNITQLLLFVTKPKATHTFEVGTIRARGSYTPPTASITDADPFFPIIDTFGQYRHKDWSGKVHSLAELQQRRADEAKALARDSGPADWDKYGGWRSGPELVATGFFRVQKVGGKWWLVDPDGHLFWSHGIDCVRMTDVTPIDERESWFENFPGGHAEFAEFVIPRAYALKGHYAGRSPRCFIRGSESQAQIRRRMETRRARDDSPAPAQLGTQHDCKLVRRKRATDAPHALHGCNWLARGEEY